jgi:Carboxypeptidase regulatory-like domain/TonB dependent receptor
LIFREVRSMRHFKILASVGMMVCLLAAMSRAQVSSGTISGTVKDSTGAVIPGTKVEVVNEETGISRTIESDEGGRFTALSLSLGNYRVTGSHEGFETEVRKGIELTVGREAVVDLTLTVGAAQQTVEVTGEAPLVETTSASLGSLVDDRTIRALPLNGRSYDQLALLQPGVVLASPGVTSGQAFQFGTGKRFTVGGQRDVSNSFLLDGTSINDWANGTPGGASGTNLGVDTILEFKVFTNSVQAEYGHSSGATVTAVTRSGSNDIHGTGFEYIRNSAVDARNYFDVGSSPPDFKRNQFGGVLGGPIKKDKIFFFTGYEGLRQGLGTSQTAAVPTVLAREGILPTAVGATTTMTVPVNPAIAPYLALYPLPNGRDFGDGTANYLSAPQVVTNEDNFMGRLDYQLNAKTGIFARYTLDTDSLNSPQNLPDLFEISTSRRQYSTLQANSILSPQALNNIRYAFNRTNSRYAELNIPDPGPAYSFIPGQPMGALVVGGAEGTGSRSITPLTQSQGNGPVSWVYNVFQLSDDYSYVKGKHSFKTGFDIERIQDNMVTTTSPKGEYSFSTYENFLTGTASTLLASYPIGVDPYQGLRQSLFAVYGQDDYAVNSRVTLNLGLRWETPTDPYEVHGLNAFLPTPASTSTLVGKFTHITKANFGPRAGVEWRLNSSGKSVLRAGGGINYNQDLPWFYGFVTTTLPPFFGKYSVSNPPFPNGVSVLGPGALLQLTVLTPVEKTPTSDQYNLSFQQQISGNTVFQVDYAGNQVRHLPTQSEADTTIPTFVNGSLAHPYYAPKTARLNPAWAGIRLYQANGNSHYNSGTVTLRRQSPSGLVGEIFYTFAKSMDEASGTTAADSQRSPGALLDPYDPAVDWGLADFNVKSAVGANFSYPLPFRMGSRVLGAVVNAWTLDGIATFQTGMPFTARLPSAVSGDQASVLAERPNLKPGFSQNPTHKGTSAGCPGFLAGTHVGGATNYFDPCSFSTPVPSPTVGSYGNLGRNTLIGPGVEDMDMALEKSFNPLEKVKATFRFEMFNILNHTNFGLPNTTALAAGGAASPSAGQITYTTTTSRQLQLALRLSF